MREENKNLFFAIALCMAILIGWNYFFSKPVPPAQQQQQQTQQTVPGQAPANAIPGGVAPQPAAVPALETREAVLAKSPRLRIDTPSITGSIALRGARIDDVQLKRFRETVDPASPIITLMSPSGSPNAYFAEFSWLGKDAGPLPAADTLWSTDSTVLTPEKPVVLTWDNGKGLIFTRTITLDDKSMFSITDSVKNNTGSELSLAPYGLVARHGKPHVMGYYVLHEGLIGVLGEKGLQEYTYDNVAKEAAVPGYDHGKIWDGVTGGFLGITDKYWAAAIIPDQSQAYQGSFTSRGDPSVGTIYQATAVAEARTVAPGESIQFTQKLFAGAKEMAVIDGYQKTYSIKNFDLMIDWGWFYFITKPLFKLIDFLYKFVGNFGVSILIVTLFLKLVFLPLANKSYASMAKMKAVQPEMTAIRERFPDDKVKQQQAIMELYKKEKINPVSGCWPMLIQIPVFFALYKVLFVSIEMRQAPFFGWIRDLSAPDPTTLFNLFGLLPFDPSTVPVLGPFLMLGAWPIFMGVTMWLQMKMNPQATDPTQQMVFTWMPLIFTFMLAHFPAGLVIYWAWNNLLSVVQQFVIMKRNGVKVELWDNLSQMFKRKPSAEKPGK